MPEEVELRVAVRERQAEREAGPKGRLAGACRVAVASALLAGALGGVATWRAVDRLDEAWARHAVVQGERADLDAVIRARLNEAVGVTGPDAGLPTADDALQAELDDLLHWAGTDDEAGAAPGGGAAGEALAREAELVEAAEAGGAVDERPLVRLESALRELDRTTVRPAADAADTAHDGARRTVAVTLGLAAVSAGAAAWLGRAIRADDGHAARRRAP